MNENARKAAMYAELYNPKTPVVHVDLFAELEKELAEARAEIENLHWRVSDEQAKTMAALELNGKALELVNEARADAEHWKSECNALQRMVHEARTEIEKQDTLLEKCLSLLKQQKERGE